MSPESAPITVEEAKAWYEGTTSAKGRKAAEKSGELAFWKYAKEGKLANGVDVVSVPLLYNSHSPVSVPSDENFVKQGDSYSLTSFDRVAYQIQQKLLISKDEQGNPRSVVITIIPNRKDQRKKEKVKKDNFSGAILIMNESGDNFERGWHYKNGKVVDTFYPVAQSANGRMGSYTCKVGFYQLMAQNPRGNSGGYNCTPGNDRTCLPSAYLDQATGGFWVLTATFDATCDDGVPNGAPRRENPWDDRSSWVAADPNGGGGGGPVIRDPFSPIDPTPIDYGMPIDLDPADAFAWEMANRIGEDVFLTGEEIELVRSNWSISYKIRDYVARFNQKPNIIEFASNYRVTGPDRRIHNLKERLNCFGQITNDGNHTYKVTLYSDQPVQDSRETYSLSNSYRKVGHTFIGIEKHNVTSNQTVRLVFGFYIAGTELTALTNMSVAGAWGDDGNTQYDVSVTNDLTSDQFSNLINTLKSVGDNSAPNYHLVNNNCTTFTYNLLSGYLTLPNGVSEIGFLGRGTNPAGMCEDLRSIAHIYGGRLNSGNNMIAPASTNCN